MPGSSWLLLWCVSHVCACAATLEESNRLLHEVADLALQLQVEREGGRRRAGHGRGGGVGSGWVPPHACCCATAWWLVLCRAEGDGHQAAVGHAEPLLPPQVGRLRLLHRRQLDGPCMSDPRLVWAGRSVSQSPDRPSGL